MRRLTRSVLALALASACCGAAAADEAVPTGRLPTWAQPQEYALDLKIDPAQDSFSGTTTIKVKLTQASDHLWIDGKELKVGKVSVTGADGKAAAAKYTVADAQAGVARIDFGKTLQPQELTLSIAYTAPFNQALEGLYKVTYEGKPYAMTQMEPISARFAFPSFDEPAFKTPYDIKLTIPADLQAVANTAQVQEAPTTTSKRWKTLTFARTLPLPTYLVAFAVGPWDIVDGPGITATPQRAGTLPLRGVAPNGKGPRMKIALDSTPVIIHTLEDYYDFGYPFDKLDQLAAPDFSAGAMENAGLVTYRDYLLLLDKDSATSYKRSSFNVIAHELAHQWTGDTVTMSWWNDLWLNESFATWMQQKVTMKVHPEYRADLDRVQGAQGAMSGDALVATRKMRQEITGNGDIENAFDGITYQKGAAVLGMFEAYVGEDTFRTGMRQYIQRHKFGNATADDLVSAIATAAGKGPEFTAAFNSFLDQPGVPYVHTEVTDAKGQVVLKLTQRRYLPLGSTGDSAKTWGVPVCVRYQTSAGSDKACTLLSAAGGTLALPGAKQGGWVMPNAGAAGYYRIGLDAKALKTLTADVAQLTDAEQLAYGDGVSAAFDLGELNPAQLLAALKPLTASKVSEVATVPTEHVGWLYGRLARTDAQRAALTRWAEDAYLPRMQQLGYVRKDGEEGSDALERAELAGFLALSMKVPAARAELLKQGDAVLAGGKTLAFDQANPDLLAAALSVSVQEHGAPAVDQLMAALPGVIDPAHRNAMLSALSRTEDPALAAKVRSFGLGKDVKVGEMRYLLTAGKHTTVADRDTQWTWFTQNYDAIHARIGAFAGGSLPRMASAGACTPAESDRLQAFFEPRLKDLPGAIRGLQQARESIALCAALTAKQDPAALVK
ncbi:M1 family metallopeptidase [Pseudoxanthomonas winnipegensis]|uniref:M1 family metallopeptidase n=1 Tax=Pseudoxanthomonas winnipegensis TaxID=2480810 RepID=UPI002578BEA9|nr:M1 family metallopeptidase [Pseudoxanthomonas winnipegensis]WJI14677.1 M1 family metallopeptidase [Pseudoxanthomonas winnipegensis]